MKERSERRSSLYLECFLWLFLAGMVSLLFYMVSLFVAEQQIDVYHRNHNLTQYYNEKNIAQIQKYITQHNISSKDLERLEGWVKDNRLIYIQVKKGNEWIYSSNFDMDDLQYDEYDVPGYPEDSYYDVQLSDGTVQMFIMGMYSYKPYIFALITDIIVSFLLFFFLVMLGIRKKIIYINQMSRDIEILEGGNLEYMVHVQGNDEIADLARGLNAMKDSFKNQIKEVERLTRTNQEMVTEISHDLRTPLTAVLLYAEILQNGKYREEGNKQDYLNKIVRKIQHMKELSDKMLAYSAQAPEGKFIPAGNESKSCLHDLDDCREGRIPRPLGRFKFDAPLLAAGYLTPAEYVPIRSGLYDELSDMCGYLEEQGMKVKVNLRWEEGSVFLYEEYLVRILDNLASNILKYADAQALVLIWDDYYVDEMCIFFENAYDDRNSGKDSYSIGIRNIKMMMREMEGKCEVIEEKEHFRISLRFRYKKAR